MIAVETLPSPKVQAGVAQDKAELLMMLRARGIQDLNLLRAIETVPREIFAPHRFAELARRPIALPLRCGQTLSEPWLAARMIEALELTRQHRVLEIGTGSGYATSVLARLAREVLSIERFQSLAIEAGERLARLSITNAAVVFGDWLAIALDIGHSTGSSFRGCSQKCRRTSSLHCVKRASWSPRGRIPLAQDVSRS